MKKDIFSPQDTMVLRAILIIALITLVGVLEISPEIRQTVWQFMLSKMRYFNVFDLN